MEAVFVVELRQMQGFLLKVESNKTELFQYLAEQTTMLPCEANKSILSTSDTVVLSSSVDVTPEISPCTHEEADTRLILHAFDCARQGIDNIILRTVDTDIVVLAIANFSRLQISRLWIAFGVGKQYRYIAMPGKFFLHRRDEPLRTSPLLLMHYYNTPQEWLTKLVIVGDSA